MKGQTAFEYLVLFSLVLIILSFLTYYAQDMTERNREEIIMSNAVIAVNKIAEAADIVYTQGKPSQITLSVYIPEKVYSIEFSNKMMIMRINVSSGSSDIFATSKAPFCCSSYCSSLGCPTSCINIGCISTDSGTKRIKVKAEKNDTTGESYVNITES
jgi:uncharacterized protein (UPF0333 family)